MSNAMHTQVDPATELSAELDALLEKHDADCGGKPWLSTVEVCVARYNAVKALRAKIDAARATMAYEAPTPALRAYPVSRREEGPGYMVDVMGGPGSIVWRVTERAALEDGAAYVKAYWHKTAKGQWFAV